MRLRTAHIILIATAIVFGLLMVVLSAARLVAGDDTWLPAGVMSLLGMFALAYYLRRFLKKSP